jgi:hypothetical protein
MSQRFHAWAKVGREAGKRNHPDVYPYLVALLLMSPILMMLWFELAKIYGEKQEARACVDHHDELQTVQGILRQAGTDLFVQSDRWRLLTHGCVGKSRRSCLAANPNPPKLGMLTPCKPCSDAASHDF